MMWGAVIFWGCVAAALSCYGYAAYILWAWRDPAPDTRLSDFMAALSAKNVAAFTFVLTGLFMTLLAFITHVLTTKARK